MANQQINQVTSNSEMSEDARENQQSRNADDNSQRHYGDIASCFMQSPISSGGDGGTLVHRKGHSQTQTRNKNRGIKDFLQDVSKCLR